MYETRCPHCGRTNIKERRICIVCGKEIRLLGKYEDDYMPHIKRVNQFNRILMILILAASIVIMLKTHLLDKLFVR